MKLALMKQEAETFDAGRNPSETKEGRKIKKS